MRSLRTAALALVLALSGTAAFAEGGEHGLEEILIESAATPAQHQALAKHFRAKTEQARAEAKKN